MDLHVKKHDRKSSCFAKKIPAKRRVSKTRVFIMRCSLLAIFLSIGGLLMARDGNGQDLDKIMISVNLRNSSLKSALHTIENETQLPFTYKTNDIAPYKNINYKAKEISVARLLTELLKHTDLGFEQVNSNIVIKKLKSSEPGNADAQRPTTNQPSFDGSLRGRVADARGDAVANASIQVVGTSQGSIANERGEFFISGITAGPHRLQVTAVGFEEETRDINIRDNEETFVNFQLKAKTSDLQEVVVTALGVRKEKRALGYSSQEIKGEDLLGSRQTNIVNALRGKVAGVQINSGGGAPGQGSHILIRGIKSLSPGKDQQPLFVVDGVLIDNSTTTSSDAAELRGLTNRAADINPDDVESYSILRGGAATALYGQAGSNGVILITTKSAKAGKMRVDFTTTYGIDQVNKYPDVQTRFTQGNNGVYDPESFFPSWGPTVEEARAIDPTHPAKLFDKYKRGYQDGNQFRSSINLSGGTENALLTSSFSYFKQNGVIPNSDFKSITARVGGQFKFGNKLKFNPSIFFANSGGFRVNADRFNELLSYWSPRWDVKDYIKPDGTQKTYVSDNSNAIFGTYINRFRDNVNRVIANMSLTYSPFKWLDVDYRLGMDYYADFRRHTGPGPLGLVDEIPFEDNGQGFVDEYRISNRILNSIVMATLKKDWTSKLSTVLRVGNEVREKKFSRLTSNGSELDIPDLLTLNNAKIRSTNQYDELYRIVSAYGDFTISWDNFLFLNATGRNEWTSTLKRPNNSFFYPSLSLSYVFSDQFKMPYWLNFGKARISYAEVGKDTDPYETNTYYDSYVLTSSGQVLWTRGNTKGDESLRPEKTRTIEIGAELKFFKSRLGVDFSWYKLRSRDLIIPVSLSPTTGFTSSILNAGEIENKGIEVILNGTPIKTKDFTWDATLNFSANNNKVVKIREGLTEIIVASQFGYSGSTATMKYVPGYAVGNIYGTSYQRYYAGKPDDGVTLERGLPIVIATTGSNRGFPARDATQRILGNSQPDWIGGITNTFTYKNFSLSFLWETQQGQDRYNQLSNFMSAFGIAKYTENRRESIVFDGVHADGTPNSDLVWLGQGVGPDGRNYTAGYYRNVHRGVTENFVEDASWVRLRNLTLGYRLPANLLKNGVIKGAVVTLTGNNLLLFTDYSGFDPETSSNSAGSNADAFTGFTYPAIRSYLLSINLNF